jgi:UDP-hydrolysing UDP-N-acetyl-D-glucosamine 2-epimerase
MRIIGIVTTSRADYGIYRPLLKAIEATPSLDLFIFASGTHLSPDHGFTVRQIKEDGFAIGAKVECLPASDDPAGVAMALGKGMTSFARCLAQNRPDILVVLGDRFEMFAAACAAAPQKIPLAHIHGGELTQGALDDQFRHAMTKLSHLHFVATGDYAERVIQMGEEPWRVTVCGALSLDNLDSLNLMEQAQLEAELGISLDPAPLLVTYHPETLMDQKPANQVGELLAGLEKIGMPAIFTLPNADAGGGQIASQISRFVNQHDWAHIRDNLGSRRYFSLMRWAAAMVGNSSSGIIEAPSFGLPVVNLGARQQGRTRAANVIDVALDSEAVVQAIQKVLEPSFKASLQDIISPYYRGGAAATVLDRLAAVDLGQRLLVKEFHDMKAGHA